MWLLFQLLNAIIGNVKTALNGTHHSLNFKKYADRYLGEMSYRFNRQFYLKSLLQLLLMAGINCEPQQKRLLKPVEHCCLSGSTMGVLVCNNLSRSLSKLLCPLLLADPHAAQLREQAV